MMSKDTERRESDSPDVREQTAASLTGESLTALLYDELRLLAQRKLRHEWNESSLQTTDLVHEAYLRVEGSAKQEVHWDSRGHFFASAAEAMRRVLIDRARRRASIRNGGSMKRIQLPEIGISLATDPQELLQLNDVIELLEQVDGQAAQVTKLRLFAGLSVDDAANLLGISRATCYREWTYARAFLQTKLNESFENSDFNRN